MSFIARPSSGALLESVLLAPPTKPSSPRRQSRSLCREQLAPPMRASLPPCPFKNPEVFRQGYEAKAQPLAPGLFIVRGGAGRGTKPGIVPACARRLCLTRHRLKLSRMRPRQRHRGPLRLSQTLGLDANHTYSLSPGGDMTFSGLPRHDGFACSVTSGIAVEEYDSCFNHQRLHPL